MTIQYSINKDREGGYESDLIPAVFNRDQTTSYLISYLVAIIILFL